MNVEAKISAGRENPIQIGAPAPLEFGAFFVLDSAYGGWLWAGFGLAGFLFDRFLTPQPATSNCVRTVVGGSNQI